MMKRVEVASTDSRAFVKAVIELAQQGASLPDDAGVFKGIMLRCQLELPEDVLVKASPIVRVLPIDKKEKEAYAKEQAQKNIIPVNTQKQFEEKEEALSVEVATEVEKKSTRGRKKVEE